MAEDIQEGIKKIKDKVSSYSIHMSRVPKNTYDRFMELCSEEEFSSDRGMLLKYLLDFYMGIIPTGIEHLEAEIEVLKEKIVVLENKNKEEQPVRKRLDGTGGK